MPDEAHKKSILFPKRSTQKEAVQATTNDQIVISPLIRDYLDGFWMPITTNDVSI
jgi:hypothetical protein